MKCNIDLLYHSTNNIILKMDGTFSMKIAAKKAKKPKKLRNNLNKVTRKLIRITILLKNKNISRRGTLIQSALTVYQSKVGVGSEMN